MLKEENIGRRKETKSGEINDEINAAPLTVKKCIRKELCRRYPFLIPRNRFTDAIPEDFDYSWTELDAMPDGWRTAFGEQMCEEIAQALIKDGYLEKYRILQIKEKYGELRWYDKGATQEVYDIIEKYSLMSTEICIECGKPAILDDRAKKERSLKWIDQIEEFDAFMGD